MITDSWRKEFGMHWPLQEPDGVYRTLIRKVTDIDTLLPYIPTKGIAVQAGGMVGMWPARMAKFFERVYTFEPTKEMYPYLVANTAHLPGVITYNAALGRNFEPLRVSYKPSGCSKIYPKGTDVVETLTIDYLDLPRCDLIYLDVEGYELQALEGALRTIEAFKPLLVLEFGPENEKEYLRWAAERRYELVTKVHSDMVLKWK